MRPQYFKFLWYEKKNPDLTRTNIVELAKPSFDTGRDAHAALDLLETAQGKLTNIEIISIQEYREDKPYGEPILPSSSAIVPTK